MTDGNANGNSNDDDDDGINDNNNRKKNIMHNNKKKKQFKPLRPFRIKPRTIVAVRYKSPSESSYYNNNNDNNNNNNDNDMSSTSSKYTEIWLDPVPGRDINYNLIGKRIRCMFPKKYHPDMISKSSCRILEGEVIAIISSTSTSSSSSTSTSSSLSSSQNVNEFQVQLLVDKEYSSKMPFLTIVNDNNHSNNSTNGNDDGTISKGERKRRLYEEMIRGRDTIIVSLALAHIVPITSNAIRNNADIDMTTTAVTATTATTATATPEHTKTNKATTTAAAATAAITTNKPIKWVIRKWVPTQQGKIVKYIGDGHDDTLQQEKNYRWLSTNQQYNDYDNDNNNNNNNSNSTLSSQYYHGHNQIGEVIKVELNKNNNNDDNNDKPSTSSSSCLAMVTVKRMITPEVTKKGRLAIHGKNEIFDLDHPTNDNDNDNGDDYNNHNDDGHDDSHLITSTFQIPIENLIVIGHTVQRHDTTYYYEHYDRHEYHDDYQQHHELFVRYKYNITKDVFHLIHNNNNDHDHNFNNHKKKNRDSNQICHGCKREQNRRNMKLCSYSHCGANRSSSSTTTTTTDDYDYDNYDGGNNVSRTKSKWWCHDCIFHTRPILNTYERKESDDGDDDNNNNWIGPCCLGLYNCFQSRYHNNNKNHHQVSEISIIKTSIMLRIEQHKSDGKERMSSIDSNDNSKAIFCTTCRHQIIGQYHKNKTSSHCRKCSKPIHTSCRKWENSLHSMRHTNGDDRSTTRMNNRCLECVQYSYSKKRKNRIEQGKQQPEEENLETIQFPSRLSLLTITKAFLDTTPPCDFDLPFNFLENYPKPQSDPFDFSMVLPLPPPPPKRQRKQYNKKISDRPISPKTTTKKANSRSSSPKPKTAPKTVTTREDKDKLLLQKPTSQYNREEEEEIEMMKVSKPTCTRCISYDTVVKSRTGVRQTNNSAAHAARSVASIRSGGRKIDRSKGSSSKPEKKSSGRAARASHRRRNKEIERLGLEQQTNMVGREDVLRFGKSLIHGWGVFTDGDISAGDLIVEYRGVLIGNKIADRREKEYESAKIGSDYMFRIDSEIVCDATHEGNVARFINASCTPNCYTQIITLNGAKRIAIYAKKDISPGEELSYDYKFEPEFMESKRIPCNCGTADCRGFMNWNKKYIAITNMKQLEIEQSNQSNIGRGIEK